MGFYHRVGKRVLDLMIVLAFLPFWLLVWIIAAALVRLQLGLPVHFRQTRPGRFGKPFVLLKLRTMTNETRHDGQLLPDEQRLTRLGVFLRTISLDEFPTLWNVLQGNMSLVGPRPLLMQYLPLYSSEQARRHEVKPGITGWAQVNGRNALSWEEKFRLDVWYVDHLSFWLDVRILWRTLIQVIRRQGISADGHATMPPFTGDQEETRETT